MKNRLIKQNPSVNNKDLNFDENDLPIETPLVPNKPFKKKGKRLDYDPSETIKEADEEEIKQTNNSQHNSKPKIASNVPQETKNRNILIKLILFRLFNCYLIKTWFAPDEYWQSQEVAHYLAFDYGYLTWEWKVGIRSYLYPAIISFWYKILQFLYLDDTNVLVYVSPVLHSLLAALADYTFYNYVKQNYDDSIAFKANLCRLMSWFTFYISPRSLTNNIEEILTIFILSSYPTKSQNDSKKPTSFYYFHLLSFISFSIRATSAINLIPIYIYYFFQTKLKLKFLQDFIVVGIVVLSLNTLLDSYLHGGFLLSWFNFFLYNVYKNIGTHYGTHPWYWYITSGYPTLLTTHLIPFTIGLSFMENKLLPIFGILFNLLVYSLLSHKEFRFLNQTMPFAMIICAHGFKYMKETFGKKAYKITIAVIASSNIIMALFLSLFHQRAPIAIMDHLRNNVNLKSNDSILFLTPCHSTPYYSYLHKNITMNFLTCEPNLNNTPNYIDEADEFFSNPFEWLDKNKKLINESTYIILFENLYNQFTNSANEGASKILNKFYVCTKFFYSFTKQTQNTDKKLLLLCLRKSAKLNADLNNKDL